MFEGAPTEVLAIVVGVDNYKACEMWNLNGPTRDALDTVDWLCDQGVPEQNIALFLSPDSWETQLVKERLALRVSLGKREAISQVFAKYINEELPGVTATALLLHWGGHGVVSDQADRQYLYTADATKDVPHCICAQELVNAFRNHRYRNLKQQVFVFDVCANQERIFAGEAAPLPARLVDTRSLDATIAQCQMYGASRGKRAVNNTGAGREGGLFSQLLFEELRKYPAPSMQNFKNAFMALQQNGGLHELHKQVPLMIEPGHYVSRQPTWQLTPDEQWLFARIHEINPAHSRLKRLYLQSQPHVELRPIVGDLEQWLRDLKDTRPRLTDGYPSPLIEFAERVGRELAAPDLQDWACRQCKPGHYRTLQTRLENEQQIQDKQIASLFIEIKTEDALEFSWWLEGLSLEATNTQSVAIGSDGLHATLNRILPDILAHAAGLVQSHFELRIGFILPAGLLLSGLERIVVQPPEEDDAPVALNEQYPVLFHWSVRLSGRSTPSVNNWNSLVEVLQQRVESGDGTGVIWLEQGDHDDKTRYVRAFDTLRVGPEAAISLGIEHLPDELDRSRLETIKLCLKRGVPCLFWLQQPGASDEARALRDRIGGAFARQLPRSAPLSLLREQRGVKLEQQLGVNHIVWDLPSYLPAHNPNQSLLEDHL